MKARGQYGSWASGHRGVPLVGLIHTPQDTEDEINQLHGEIMQFGGEVATHVAAATARVKESPEYKASLARVKEAAAYVESLRQKYKAQDAQGQLYERVGRLLGFSPPDLGAQWIRDYFRINNPGLAKELDERLSAVKIWRERGAELADLFNRLAKSSPVLLWEADVWEPFRMEWLSWRSGKVDVPAQMWPGSGARDRTQDYRAKYIEIRNKAPFKAVGPAPIQPDGRRDPSLLGGLSDFGSTFKWVLLGVLGVGGVLAVSSIASNLKKRDRS